MEGEPCTRCKTPTYRIERLCETCILEFRREMREEHTKERWKYHR